MGKVGDRGSATVFLYRKHEGEQPKEPSADAQVRAVISQEDRYTLYRLLKALDDTWMTTMLKSMEDHLTICFGSEEDDDDDDDSPTVAKDHDSILMPPPPAPPPPTPST